jgi:hypothetical protein
MLGSTLLTIECCCVVLLCLFLIRTFASQLVPYDIKISVTVSWILGFVGVFLLPYDLSLSWLDEGKMQESQSKFLQSWWLVLYWITFILAWLVLPLQQEFHGSGYFTTTDRLKDAVRSISKYYIFIIIICIAYILYTAASEQTEVVQVYSLLMALGNTYGVLLLVTLAASGMVLLPRYVWHISDLDKSLRMLYIESTKCESSVLVARGELEECEREVQVLQDRSSGGTDSDLIQCLQDKVIEFRSTAKVIKEANPYSRSLAASAASEDTTTETVSLDTLVSLHTRLKKRQIKALTCEYSWQLLQDDVFALEQAVAERDGLQCMHTEGQTASCTYSLSQFLISKKRYALQALACALAGLSVMFLWCEIMIPMQINSPFAYVLGVYEISDNSEIKLQLYSSIILIYLTVCAYYSLFTINLGWKYTIRDNQKTPYTALVFNAEYTARLQFALCYNLIMLIDSEKTEYCAFQTIMQRMETTPVLGTGVSTYLPTFMVLTAILTYLNLHSKILNMVPGFELDKYTEGSEEEESRVETGKRLIASERRLRSNSKRKKTTNNISPTKSHAPILNMTNMTVVTAGVYDPLPAVLDTDDDIIGGHTWNPIAAAPTFDDDEEIIKGRYSNL